METQLQDLVEEECPGDNENDEDRTFGDRREDRTLSNNSVDRTLGENNTGKMVGEKQKIEIFGESDEDRIFCEKNEDKILTFRQLSPSVVWNSEEKDDAEIERQTLLIDSTSFRWTCDVEIQI